MLFLGNVKAFFDRFPEFEGLRERTMRVAKEIAEANKGMITSEDLKHALGPIYGMVADAIGYDVSQIPDEHLAVIDEAMHPEPTFP